MGAEQGMADTEWWEEGGEGKYVATGQISYPFLAKLVPYFTDIHCNIHYNIHCKQFTEKSALQTIAAIPLSAPNPYRPLLALLTISGGERKIVKSNCKWLYRSQKEVPEGH